MRNELSPDRRCDPTIVATSGGIDLVVLRRGASCAATGSPAPGQPSTGAAAAPCGSATRAAGAPPLSGSMRRRRIGEGAWSRRRRDRSATSGSVPAGPVGDGTAALEPPSGRRGAEFTSRRLSASLGRGGGSERGVPAGEAPMAFWPATGRAASRFRLEGSGCVVSARPGVRERTSPARQSAENTRRLLGWWSSQDSRPPEREKETIPLHPVELRLQAPHAARPGPWALWRGRGRRPDRWRRESRRRGE